MDAVHWSPSAVTAAVLDLAGELAEHLRGPDDVRSAGEWLAARYAELARPTRAGQRKIVDCQRTREQLLPLVAGVRRGQGRPGGHRLRRPDGAGRPDRAAPPRGRRRPSGAATRSCCSTSTRTPATPSWSCCGRCSAAATRSPRSATRASPSTAGAAPARATCAGSPPTSRSRGGGPAPVAAAVHQLPQHRPGAGRRRADPGARCGPRRAEVPRLIAPPGRAGRGLVTCALLDDRPGRGGLDRRPDRRAARACRPAWPRTAGPGRTAARTACTPATSPCCAASGPSSRRCAPRWRPRGIPVEVVGLGGLLTVPEVADIVATLRVLHDPGASDALARLLTGPALADRPA